MPQALPEAAKAVRQHAKAIARAEERKAALIAEVEAVDAQLGELKTARAGLEYALWSAALGEVDEVPEG